MKLACSEYRMHNNCKWLLLFPRLDATFKEGPVPEKYYEHNIAPVRKPWLRFAENVVDAASDVGAQLRLDLKPLWQFKEENYVDVRESNLLVPHKEFHNFMVPGKRNFYYMQSVIPHLFSIDTKGWGGNLSILPFRENNEKITHWDEMQERLDQNISKFAQPDTEIDFEPGYVLFLCQIPHDQTIQFHSDISVYAALEETIRACKNLGKRLVVKGHPVNPASMETMRRLVQSQDEKMVKWVDNYSIHSLIKNAEHCVTVNSGSGIEAILHLKPIYAFGKAEYSQLVPRVSVEQWLEMEWYVDEYDYMNFIESYVNSLYDTTKPETFLKLFEA